MNTLHDNPIDQAIQNAIHGFEGAADLTMDEIQLAVQEGRKNARFDAIMAKIAQSATATEVYCQMLEIKDSTSVWSGLKRDAGKWIEGVRALPDRISDQLRTLFMTPNPVPVYRGAEDEIPLPVDPANQTLKPGKLDDLGASKLMINGQEAKPGQNLRAGDAVEATFEVETSDDWVIGKTEVKACFVVMSPEEAFDLEWAEAASGEAPVVSAMLMYRAGRFAQAEQLLDKWPADEYLAPYAQAVRGSAAARRRDAARVLD